ncbi:WD40 repeat domain-containing protein [Amycolatopsis sp. EV170708-02-1]|uniref:WD40 repeat domain-containing protein n=1 Tax=Amycolatopsis sp. EV170708-02-1 TaxID=2919322 RepID=UPI001F0C636C|nr:WD40 repeat domain-containing protein [Amycolatopsis sp. EV170708-02-1]UMP00019.1 WD40 repeat domain-containing protein [Amycolatopsis sp. EV170708-02-1]
MAPLADSFLTAELYDQVLVWEVGNWKASRMLGNPSESVIRNVSTGGNLVCANDDRQVIVWNVRTWDPPVYLEISESRLCLRDKPLPTRPPLRIRLARKLRGPISRIRRWPLGQQLNGWLNRRLTLARKPAGELGVEISASGDWIAVAARNEVHITSTLTWKSITKLSLDDSVQGLLVIPKRHWLAIVSNGRVQYWNTENWLPEQGNIDKHIIESANDGDWSPDGSLLATVSEERTLRVHDSGTGVLRTEIRIDGELTGVAWLSSDLLAAVGAHGVYWFNYVSDDKVAEATQKAEAVRNE